MVSALLILLGPEETRETLSMITPAAMTVLFSFQLATLAAGAWIWHLLLTRKSRISFARVFIINQAAGLVESLTPSVKFGGEAAKVYLFRKKTRQTYHEIAGVLLVQKFITMIPFALLCLIIIVPALYLFSINFLFTAAFILLLSVCLALGWLCYGSTGAGSSPAKTDQLQAGIIKRPMFALRFWISKAFFFISQARQSAAGLLSVRQTLVALSVSLAIWAFYPVKVYLACHFLGFEISPGIIVLATFLAYMISMIPLSPGGLGTYEGTMAMLLTIGGVSPAEGLAIALVSRLTTFWFPLGLSALASMIVLWSPGTDEYREGRSAITGQQQFDCRLS